MLTKAQAKAALGIETDADLARVFEINRWAVGQWGDHDPVPELRELQLRMRYPEKFSGQQSEAA
jgi:hypothetical protein